MSVYITMQQNWRGISNDLHVIFTFSTYVGGIFHKMGDTITPAKWGISNGIDAN